MSVVCLSALCVECGGGVGGASDGCACVCVDVVSLHGHVHSLYDVSERVHACVRVLCVCV